MRGVPTAGIGTTSSLDAFTVSPSAVGSMPKRVEVQVAQTDLLPERDPVAVSQQTAGIGSADPRALAIGACRLPGNINGRFEGHAKVQVSKAGPKSPV